MPRMNERGVRDCAERPATGANESLAIVAMGPNGGERRVRTQPHVPVPQMDIMTRPGDDSPKLISLTHHALLSVVRTRDRGSGARKNERN